VKLAAAVSVASVVFVVLALPFLNQPIDSWEWLHRCAAERIAASGVPSLDYPLDGAAVAQASPPALLLIHPPSSANLSAVSLRLLGDGAWQTRVPGLLAVVVTAALLAALVWRRAERGPEASRLAILVTVLYLFHPATLQGALYLGFSEGTLLPLTWVLFLFVWLETLERSLAVRIALLGPCFAATLWAKITTSLALPVAVALVAWALRGPGMAVAMLVGVAGLGGALFLASWSGYVAYLARLVGTPAGALWAEPFRYVMGEAQVLSLAGMALNALRATLYLGPLLLLGATVAIVRRTRAYARDRRARGEDVVPLLAACVFFVYLVLPGGIGSFPKYHLVILPLLAWLAAEALGRAGAGRPLVPWPLMLAGVAYYVVLVGDPLKLLNHDLRLAQLSGDTTRVAARLALVASLYALFPIASAALLRQWRPALITATLASQLALVVVQARGGYFTKHLYGTPVADFARTVELVRASTPGGAEIVALPEFGYAARRRLAQGVRRAVWSDPGELEAVIRRSRSPAVVYGVPTQTVSQMRGLTRHPALQATLERSYVRHEVGEFTVWLRTE
jgi:hypothetical protein